MQATPFHKPNLWAPTAIENRAETLYKELNGQSPFVARCRAFFLPAREVVIGALEKPLTAIESIGRAVINGVCAPFISGYSVKNSIFYAEKAISSIVNTPLAILPLPIQYIHQVSATFFDPKTVLSAAKTPGLKTDSCAREFFSNLQDKLYAEPEKPYLSPLATRIVSPFIAGSDVFLDIASPFVETIERLASVVIQALGALFLQPGCSLKGVLYFTKEAFRGISDTCAATLLSPVKFVYQVFAICYDPEKIVSIRKFTDSVEAKTSTQPLPVSVRESRASSNASSASNSSIVDDSSSAAKSSTVGSTDSSFSIETEIETLNLMTCNEFEGKSYREQIEIINRIKSQRGTISSNVQNNYANVRQIPLIELSSLSSEQLMKVINQIPKNALCLLQDSQVEAIDVSQIAPESLFEIISHVVINKRKFIEKISVEVLWKIVKILEVKILRLASATPFKNFSLKGLTPAGLDGIFSCDFTNESKKQKRERCRIQVESLQDVVEQLAPQIPRLVSADRIEDLNLSALSPYRLEQIFSYDSASKKEQAERFARIPIEKLQDTAEKLSSETLQLVSAKQLEQFPFSLLSENKLKEMFSYDLKNKKEQQEQAKRLARIPIEKLRDILKKLPPNTLKLISAERLQVLDLSELSEYQLRWMFSYDLKNKKEQQEQAERFAHIPVEKLQLIVEKLEVETLKLVSAKQLENLDLSRLLCGKLNGMFFYSSNKKEQIERFSHIPVEKLRGIIENLEGNILRLVSEKQLESLDLSKLHGYLLKEMFAYDAKSEKEQAKRFSHIPVDNLRKIVEKFDEEMFKLVSETQRKKLLLLELPSWIKDVLRKKRK